MRKRLSVVASVAAMSSVILGLTVYASAQTFPTRPVTLIVPFPPGGVIDTTARVIESDLSKELGQPVVIENKGGSGGNLATHLERRDENEHVKILQLRGFASDDLHGAFKEVEAVSRGTKCKNYLFSVSLNPPEGANVSDEGFLAVADRLEEKLGLQGQPRAVVLHEKEGRRHAHLVMSRIDAATMTGRRITRFSSPRIAEAASGDSGV